MFALSILLTASSEIGEVLDHIPEPLTVEVPLEKMAKCAGNFLRFSLHHCHCRCCPFQTHRSSGVFYVCEWRLALRVESRSTKLINNDENPHLQQPQVSNRAQM
jgi:hypothetical protein